MNTHFKNRLVLGYGLIWLGLLADGSACGAPCNVTSTDHYCVSDGSVTLTAPTNSPVVCLGGAVTLTVGATIVDAQTETITHYDHCPDVTAYGSNAPNYGVTWTASVGNFSTNGTGLTASFTPTDCGIGSVSFSLNYTNGTPCSGTGSSGTSGSFESVQLQSIGVSGATQVSGTNNWAAVKTNDANAYVTITATLCPEDTNAAALLTWTGGEAVPGNLLERRVSKTNSVKTTVTASCCNTSLVANVWIVWATVVIQMSGENPANAPSFADHGLSNMLGVVYYNNTNSARGQVCVIGTVTPPGVHAIITNGWMPPQKRMWRLFMDGATNTYEETWTDDGPKSGNYSTSLDSNDNVYGIDGPNIGSFGASSSSESYLNFYDYVTWNGQICSETNYFWHWQGRWKSGQSPPVTYTDLGGGSITLPSKPYY